jgi:putative ABC transport system permease protein
MKFWHRLSRRARQDRELEEEMQFHLAAEARMRQGRGEPAETALRNARRDFGNYAAVQEATRDMWVWTWLERAVQDVRLALRMLRKSPAFTALALAALALGIGATTAIFSLVNSILLKPLPFHDPSRLMMIWELPPRSNHRNVVQTGNFLDWRARNRSFEDVAAMFQFPFNLEGSGEPIQLPGLRVTAGFFEILGTRPLLGRAIGRQDDVPDTPWVAVLSYELWQRRFGGRRDVIGEKIAGPGNPFEVIGVMPPAFGVSAFPHVDVYIPMRIRPDEAVRDGRNYKVIGRLRRGVSLAAAQSDMEAIAAQTSRERPDMDALWSATVVPLMEQTVGDTRTVLLALLGAVVFVLLIACANVSNLLLMRAHARRHEISVRVALGAGRWRLLHQLVTESLLLATAGGLLGFLLAWAGVPALIHMLPANFPLPRLAEIRVDRGVLAFTMLLSFACALLFGAFPAMQLDRTGVSEGLRQGGRAGSASNRRLHGTLVVTEVALAMLLVVGAGLMLRSFMLLDSVDPGFRSERLLTFRMVLVPSGWKSLDELLAQRAALIEQMLARIRTLPQVTAASSISFLPLSGSQSGSGYYRTDRPAPRPGVVSGGDVSVISDRYFRTMGIPMLAGREFEERDRAGAPQVAILNQSAARQNFPGESPLGKRMRVYWTGPPEVEIIGVASDIRHGSLDTAPTPCLFLPQAQRPAGWASLLVRVSDERGVIEAVKHQMHAVAPHQGMEEVQTMDSVLSDSLARPRLDAAVFTVFGAVALILACVGIYAVISYSVEQRTREMGIRLVLGATPASILRHVLREGFALCGSGIIVGLGASALLTRYLASLLYAMQPMDGLVYAGVTLLLATCAFAGCYFPARHATRVDPAMVLREQ